MTASQPRPEIVEAVYSALVDQDMTKLNALEQAGTVITAAERAAAEDLYVTSLLASRDHRTRWLRAMQVLLGDRQFTAEPTWADLFDGLTPDAAAELRELYDALPDGARAQYDRRYGPPEQDG